MRIILLGCAGQIGWELQRSLAPLGLLKCYGADGIHQRLDVTDHQSLIGAVQSFKPDLIVNAAAYTAVDAAEDAPDLAFNINATVPFLLAQEAKRLGALLVHYSTEYVFNGQGQAPWQETDTTAPLNVYGTSKLAGEKLIQESGCMHLIMRTSWVHATRGKNFAKSILNLAKTRETLSIVNDQIGAPTSAELLADVTAHVAKVTMSSPDHSGLYHVASSGETSWYDYAKFVIECARKNQPDLKLASVRPIASIDYKQKAKRPLNSRLKTSRFEAAFNLYLPAWGASVERTLQEVMLVQN
jgi:dTDP-4-dehydrorhamnose reductase